MSGTTTIDAAGKVLSKKNENRLTAALLEFLEVLRDSNTDLNVVKQALGIGADTQEAESDKETPRITSVPGEVAAGQLSDNIRLTTWFDAIARAISMFKENFIDVYRMGDATLERQYGAGTTRDDLASEMIADLQQLLLEYKDTYPGGGEDFYYPYYGGFYASAKEKDVRDNPKAPIEASGNSGNSNQKLTELLSLLLRHFKGEEPVAAQAQNEGGKSSQPELPVDGDEPSPLPDVIQARGVGQLSLIEKDLQIFIEFDDSAKEILAARKNVNQVPFEGVLCRVDEPSESPPSKGSNYPLYLPRHVADQAAAMLNASAGLPLDVDPSLQCHSDTNIVGIMNSAEIGGADGKDFVVRGCIFGRNQAEKAALIASNKESLGMSMNALATGHRAEIDNVTVYSIDTLELTGANILLANRATWQRTRVLAAEAATVNTEGKETMAVDLDKLAEQVQALQQTVTAMNSNQQHQNERWTTFEQTLTKQNEILAAQGNVLNEIVAERKQLQAEAKERELQAAQAESQKQLTETVTQTVATCFKEFQTQYLDRMNPTRSPVSLMAGRPPGLTPLVASGQPAANAPAAEGNNANIQLSPAQYELLQASSKLAGMTESREVGPNRIKLVERCRELRQLGVELPPGLGVQFAVV
jgi:hypothetical protein